MLVFRRQAKIGIHLTIAAALFTSLAISSTPASADQQPATTVDRNQLVGSRIERTDDGNTSPLIVIDRAAIELSGESNAADLIRRLPFNTVGSLRPSSVGPAQSVATVDLRGLGAERTLVLVNGRRMPKAPLLGNASDLNMIPLGAVDRIEILPNGASALYGSDAIGGVINIVLRSDIQGAEMMIGRGQADPRSGDSREGYVNFGAASATTSLIGGASWNSREIIFARDLAWTEPFDSVFGNNFTTLFGNFDNFDWTALPGACEFPEQPAFFLSPEGMSLSGQLCAYDTSRVSADEASIKNQAAYLRADHRFAEHWQVYSDIWVAKSRSFGRRPPIGDSSFFNSPVSPTSPNNPTNPDSPMFDPSLGLEPQRVNIWHRFDALGNRDSFVDSELYDLVLGVRGQIGPIALDGGARWTRNKVFEIGYNELVRSTAFAYIEDGTYDISNPFDNPQNVLNAMKATTSRIASLDQNEVFASAAFEAGEFDDRPIRWSLGGEYREELFNNQYDSLSEAGQTSRAVGHSAGDSRSVSALFGEVLLPATSQLEVSLATRFDSYSDYGSDLSHRVALRYEPLAGYAVRGAWSEGFRAPDLPTLNPREQFNAVVVNDPVTCPPPQICSVQADAFLIANPELKAEQSEQFSLGLEFAPLDWLGGSLDYVNIKVDDRIQMIGPQRLVSIDAAGERIPPGLGVNRAESGPIRIDHGYGNLGKIETAFFDLNLRAHFDVFNGQLSLDLSVVRLQTRSIDGGRQLVRDRGVPRYRASLGNTYRWNDFDFAYHLHYISGQCEGVAAGSVQGSGFCGGRLPSWTTHDVQLSYATAWNGRISLGARNVWNRQPSILIGAFDGRDYNFDLYDAFGRITYLRYTQRFH